MTDFLHTKFEEQLEARRSEDGTIVIGSTPFTPVTILKSDVTAYENEFNIWRDEVWMPSQTEILQEVLETKVLETKVLETHANEKRFTDLCSAVKNGQLIPLIGSGVSGPSGLPTWSNLLRKLRPYSSLTADALETHLGRFEYEEAAEAIGAGMPRRLFDERIEHELRIDVPARICGAVRFLPTLFDRLVLTTNLDDIIEQVYTMQNQRFSTVLVGPNIRDYRKTKAGSASILLKLHGDCRSREGRVLGKADYETAYGAESPVRAELARIYGAHNILCVGCSLGADRTVSLLAETANQDASMPKHYAFLKHPNNDDDLRKREHFLTERGIFPIWYQGDHDDSIQALFVGMMRQVGKL